MNMQQILKAIADENRLKMIELLLKHEFCVRALSKQLGISEPAVSQHVKVLKEVNLLIGEKKNRHVHYSVNREILHELAEYIESLSLTERLSEENKDDGNPKCFGHNERGQCGCHERPEE